MNADIFTRKFALSLVLVLLPYLLIAQGFDRGREKDQRIIENIAKQYPLVKTTAELKIVLHKALGDWSVKESQSAEIIADVFIANKNAITEDRLNTTSTELFKKALLNARKLRRNDLELWVSMHYGFYLYTYRKYQDSFPLFMYCISVLDQTADGQVIQSCKTYKKIAYFLTTAGDYEKANEYLQQAKRYAEPNSRDLAGIIDALGLISISLDDLVNAEQYFKEALVIAQVSKDELRYAKVLGNLAEVRLKQKHFDRAIELLNQDITISKKLSETQNTIYALVMLGKVYLAKGDAAEASSKLQVAQQYAQSKTYFRSSEYEINSLILQIAEQTGNDKEELIARRKLEELKTLLKGMDGREAIMKVAWETEKNKLSLKIRAEETKRQRESYIKIAALLGCMMLMVAIGFLIRIYRKKIKAEKKEFEKKMLNLRRSSPVNLEMHAAKMQTLLDSHLMSNTSWLDFKRFFIQTYPDYYQFLLQNFHGLTDSHLRIIFLTKLEMDNTETARVLGLTVEAVKKAKQRLRKKYGKEYDLLFVQHEMA